MVVIFVADMLRITTPITNKNVVQPTKEHVDSNTLPFDMQDTSKIIKTTADSELLKQNNGNIDKDTAPTLLMDLLKDPSVTVSFLKNIFLLQEIVSLLPLNNQPITEEIENLFNALLVKPEDIGKEMIRQENSSTSFKGELFNFLRDVLNEQKGNDAKQAVATLLKAMNSESNRGEILLSLSNSLSYLADALSPSKNIAESIWALSEKFKLDTAENEFNNLKSQVLNILGDVESSILFSDKLSKIISIVKYNLSRYNSNKDFLPDATANMLRFIGGKSEKGKFLKFVQAFIADLHGDNLKKTETSQVMNALAEIISKNTEDKELKMLNSENIDKIIHSLLSSPCNFTPLLHFIIPVEYMDIKSFAEIWINPNEEETSKKQGEYRENIHMLLVFDIETVGQFELEIFSRDKNLELSLLCPESYTDIFMEASSSFRECVKFSEYSIKEIKIGKLEKSRSLVQVFKTLPYKRTGINVKI